jgi:hypothetical protein
MKKVNLECTPSFKKNRTWTYSNNESDIIKQESNIINLIEITYSYSNYIVEEIEEFNIKKNEKSNKRKRATLNEFKNKKMKLEKKIINKIMKNVDQNYHKCH